MNNNVIALVIGLVKSVFNKENKLPYLNNLHRANASSTFVFVPFFFTQFYRPEALFVFCADQVALAVFFTHLPAFGGNLHAIIAANALLAFKGYSQHRYSWSLAGTILYNLSELRTCVFVLKEQ